MVLYVLALAAPLDASAAAAIIRAEARSSNISWVALDFSLPFSCSHVLGLVMAVCFAGAFAGALAGKAARGSLQSRTLSH